MAINKSMRKVLKALSFDGIEVEASRHLANLKSIDPMKIFHKTIDYKIYNGTGKNLSSGREDGRGDAGIFIFPWGWMGNRKY